MLHLQRQGIPRQRKKCGSRNDSQRKRNELEKVSEQRETMNFKEELPLKESRDIISHPGALVDWESTSNSWQRFAFGKQDINFFRH